MKKRAIRALIALSMVVALCMFFSGTIKTLTTAKVKIVVPKELSNEEIQIYEKLKEVSNFEPRR